MALTTLTARRTATARAVLLAASARAVRGHGTRLPVIAALVFLCLIPAIAQPYVPLALPAVTVVLAFALQVAIDDPARSILAATPYSPARRSLNRVAAVAVIVVPIWLIVAAVVQLRVGTPPAWSSGLQAVSIWTTGLAVAVGASRTSASTTPSYRASPFLVGMVLVAHALPPSWQMFDAQPWGPPWTAAQLRWLATLMIAVGLLTVSLSDPMSRRR
jgi:hypothetical protein